MLLQGVSLAHSLNLFVGRIRLGFILATLRDKGTVTVVHSPTGIRTGISATSERLASNRHGCLKPGIHSACRDF